MLKMFRMNEHSPASLLPTCGIIPSANGTVCFLFTCIGRVGRGLNSTCGSCGAGIVRFAGRQDPDAVLNKWASNISKLLECVEKASQQIQKESMVHRVPIGTTN